jgi:hypothetical protein
MRIERANILGAFCSQLSINSDARVVLVPAKNGIKIWDLDAEKEHELGQRGETLTSVPRLLPDRLRTILTAPDDALQERLSSSGLRKWSEERETILSELRYRDVKSHSDGDRTSQTRLADDRSRAKTHKFLRFWHLFG